MSVGASLRFKHNASCLGALEFPYKGIRSITMIAVGIGVAPMVTILKAFAELEVVLVPMCIDHHLLLVKCA